MKFISREEQLGELKKNTFGTFFSNEIQNFSDKILDGVKIYNKPTVENWIDENEVHKALFLSNDIDSTRMFIGKQVLLVRDEKRKITNICFIESKALYLCAIKNNELILKETLHNGYSHRASICLDKLSGKTYTLHCSDFEGNRRLFINKTLIETVAEEVDFPFIQLEQPQIGHFATNESKYGLLSYKCRKSGKIYIREFTNEKVGEERVLDIPSTIGGLDFAIDKEKVLFRIEAITETGLSHMIAKSNDSGKTIEPFTTIDLSPFKPDNLIPTNAPVFADYLGNFQIPITAFKDGNTMLLNITPNEEIVEAIRVKGESFYASSERFPTKPKPGAELGIGNGKTDGLGLIVTIQSEGSLFSSNSQSGGHHFPKETMLNFEMPKTFCFKVTNCFTKGDNPNVVSMDYLFIEADKVNAAVSKRLILETWHMQIVKPIIKATNKDNIIELEIVENGWFEEGKTTIWIDDPTIEIKKINYLDGRNIEIITDKSKMQGSKISFEMKNLLYYHKGETLIE